MEESDSSGRRVSTSSDSEISDGWNLIDVVEIVPTEISDAESVEILYDEYPSDNDSQENYNDNNQSENRISEIDQDCTLPTTTPARSFSIKELFEVSAVLVVLVAMTLSSCYALLTLEDGIYALKPVLWEAIFPISEHKNKELSLSVETLTLENRKLREKLREIDKVYTTMKSLEFENFLSKSVDVIKTEKKHLQDAVAFLEISSGTEPSGSNTLQQETKDFQALENVISEREKYNTLNYYSNPYANIDYILNIINTFKHLPVSDISIAYLHDILQDFDVLRVLSRDQGNSQFVNKWEKKLSKVSDNLKYDIDNMLSKLLRHVNRTIVSVQTKFISKLCNNDIFENDFRHEIDATLNLKLRDICLKYVGERKKENKKRKNGKASNTNSESNEDIKNCDSNNCPQKKRGLPHNSGNKNDANESDKKEIFQVKYGNKSETSTQEKNRKVGKQKKGDYSDDKRDNVNKILEKKEIKNPHEWEMHHKENKNMDRNNIEGTEIYPEVSNDNTKSGTTQKINKENQNDGYRYENEIMYKENSGEESPKQYKKKEKYGDNINKGGLKFTDEKQKDGKNKQMDKHNNEKLYKTGQKVYKENKHEETKKISNAKDFKNSERDSKENKNDEQRYKDGYMTDDKNKYAGNENYRSESYGNSRKEFVKKLDKDENWKNEGKYSEEILLDDHKYRGEEKSRDQQDMKSNYDKKFKVKEKRKNDKYVDKRDKDEIVKTGNKKYNEGKIRESKEQIYKKDWNGQNDGRNIKNSKSERENNFAESKKGELSKRDGENKKNLESTNNYKEFSNKPKYDKDDQKYKQGENYEYAGKNEWEKTAVEGQKNKEGSTEENISMKSDASKYQPLDEQGLKNTNRNNGEKHFKENKNDNNNYDSNYKRDKYEQRSGKDQRNFENKKKPNNFKVEGNKYGEDFQKKQKYKSGGSSDRLNSSSETWFLSMGKSRENMRFESHRSDWMFDRARARQGHRREISTWFFDRAWVRHRCRMNPKPNWCNSQNNLPKDIFSTNSYNTVR